MCQEKCSRPQLQIANMKKRARSKSRTKPDVTGKNKANSKKRSPWEVLRPPPEAVLLPSEIVVEQPPPFRRALPQLDDIEYSFQPDLCAP